MLNHFDNLCNFFFERANLIRFLLFFKKLDFLQIKFLKSLIEFYREAEIIAEMQRKTEEREMQRRLSERLEKERLENLRREQERLDKEKQEAEVKELQRQVDETFQIHMESEFKFEKIIDNIDILFS